jgi:hypothetical protein
MKKGENMAKDRTRHARIREPKQESQADIVMRETVQMFERISESLDAMIEGFTAELMALDKFLKEVQNVKR